MVGAICTQVCIKYKILNGNWKLKVQLIEADDWIRSYKSHHESLIESQTTLLLFIYVTLINQSLKGRAECISMRAIDESRYDPKIRLMDLDLDLDSEIRPVGSRSEFAMRVVDHSTSYERYHQDP